MIWAVAHTCTHSQSPATQAPISHGPDPICPHHGITSIQHFSLTSNIHHLYSQYSILYRAMACCGILCQRITHDMLPSIGFHTLPPTAASGASPVFQRGKLGVQHGEGHGHAG